MKNMKRLILLVLCVLLMATALVGCGGTGSYEKKLAGSWYYEGEDDPQFKFYSDGTCEIDNSYGTGKWTVLDGNVLKVTDFYGQSNTANIISVKDGCLTLGDGGENQTVLYDKPNQ